MTTIITRARPWLNARRKALVAVLTPFIVGFVGDVLVADLEPQWREIAIVAVLTALGVERTANKS
jgi:hypothetical protein